MGGRQAEAIGVWVAPVRSALFVPGSQPRMLEKAERSAADAIWIDLEDAVSPERRTEARQLACLALGRYKQPVFVRVNSLPTLDTLEDLGAVVSPGLSGVILPKVTSARDVWLIDYLVTQAERRNGCQAGVLGVILTIETADGLVNCHEILHTQCRRVVGVLVGTSRDGDTQRSLRYQWTPDGLGMLYLRSKVLAEARAAKLPIVIEGPYADHKDADGLVSECRAARQLGYGGKAAIHPIQIDIINREFSPTKDELAYYRRVVAEMEGALSRGVGAIALDGVLVDQAMLFMARQVLESAEQCQGHEGTSSG